LEEAGKPLRTKMHFLRRHGRKAVATFSLGLFVVYGAILLRLRGPLAGGYSDFISFYTAGKILDRHAPESLYDLNLQYRIQREIAPHVPIRQGALPFVRPAFEALMFAPFARLSYLTAFVLWNLLSCSCGIAALLILRQEIPELRNLSPSLIFVSGFSYFPVFLTLLQGQDSLLLLLIYVLAFRALRRDNPLTSGLTLGLGSFKFPLVIPFLIPFLLRRKFRVLIGFVMTCVVLGAISVAIVGWSTASYYPRYLLTIDSLAPEVNRPHDMPNLRGLMSVLLPASHEVSLVVLLFLTVLALGLAARQWSLRSFDPSQYFSLGLAFNVVTTVLVSYHCHVFDLSLLLLPIGITSGALLSDSSSAIRGRRLLAWTTVSLMFSPLYLWLTFSLRGASLLAILLVGFACALGLSLSRLRSSALLSAVEVSRPRGTD
jgi:hypothetical protein